MNLSIKKNLISLACCITLLLDAKQTEMALRTQQVYTTEGIIPVVIIGAGPAGLTAGMYTSRANCKTAIFTGSNVGGWVSQIQEIENWPGKKRMSGIDAVKDLQNQAEQFGALLIDEKVTAVNFAKKPFELQTESGKRVRARVVIIATGAEPIEPQVKGVARYWGKGIGMCTICDAPFQANKEVIVAGGTDFAAERVLQLAPFAKKITMIIRGDTKKITGKVLEYLKHKPNVEIVTNTLITEVVGDEQKVTHIIYTDAQGQKKQLKTDAVFFSVGMKPNSKLFESQVKLNKDGYVLLECETQHTSVDGILAAGMVADSRYQKTASALGTGAQAGIDALELLPKDSLDNNDSPIDSAEFTDEGLEDVAEADSEA